MSASHKLPRPSMAPPPARGGALRWVVLGCGGLLFLVVAGVVLGWMILDPYGWASAELTRALEDATPAGTSIENARILFPARIAIDRLDLPANPDRGVPPLSFRDIEGTTTWDAWMRGQPNFALVTRVWGGALSLDAVTSTPLESANAALPPWTVNGALEDVLVEQCLAWLNRPEAWRGRVSVTAAGMVDVQQPRTSAFDAEFSGDELYIPPLDFNDVVLPENTRATLRGQAAYRNQDLDVTAFELRGTGYNLDATMRVTLRSRVADSPLSGRVALQLKEVATWRRQEADPELAGAMMQLLIQSKGKLHARIGGTVGDPEAVLDESALVRSLLSAE